MYEKAELAFICKHHIYPSINRTRANRIVAYIGLLKLNNGVKRYYSRAQRYLFLGSKLLLNINIYHNFRKIEHDKYNNRRIEYDFALLRMLRGFDLPNIPNVAPACLPTGSRPTDVDVRKHYMINVYG